MHAEEIANQFYSELDRKLIRGLIGSEGCGAAVHLSSVALTFCERLKELAAPQCASTYGASSFSRPPNPNSGSGGLLTFSSNDKDTSSSCLSRGQPPARKGVIALNVSSQEAFEGR